MGMKRSSGGLLTSCVHESTASGSYPEITFGLTFTPLMGLSLESNLKSKIVEYCRMRLEEYLPSDNFPVALYHYTSAEAMLNIVKSGKLWVHNIEYLNDKTELRHAVSIFRARLDLLRAGPCCNDVQRLQVCLSENGLDIPIHRPQFSPASS